MSNETTKKAQIRELTAQNPELGAPAIADKVGCSNQHVYRVWRQDRESDTSAESDGSSGGSSIDVEPGEQPTESTQLETEDLEMDDTDDSKDYECGNCGHPLDYLGGDDADGGGKKCPECGERVLWSRV